MNFIQASCIDHDTDLEFDSKTMKQYPAKPFVKWAGGKGQLLTTLGQALPETFCNIEDAVYIEPFVGGGAMLFFMLQNFGNIKKPLSVT